MGSFVALYETATGAEVARLTLVEGRRGYPWANAVAVSPDGTLLAAGMSDGDVQVWDLHGRRRLEMLYGHGGAVLTVARLTFPASRYELHSRHRVSPQGEHTP